jgi:hypothetical protein
MNKTEQFTYKGQVYPKGTVVIRNYRGKVVRDIFLWRYTHNNDVLVISPGCYSSTSGVPRCSVSYETFCSTIIRIESPTTEDMQQVARIDAEFSPKNRVKSDDGIGLFLGILALGVGTLLFPPIGIIAIIYAFSRK